MIALATRIGVAGHVGRRQVIVGGKAPQIVETVAIYLDERDGLTASCIARCIEWIEVIGQTQIIRRIAQERALVHLSAVGSCRDEDAGQEHTRKEHSSPCAPEPPNGRCRVYEQHTSLW